MKIGLLSVILCLLCDSFTHSATADSLAEENLPPQLQAWVSWVKSDYEAIDCPAINRQPYTDLSNHICAWSSHLTLDVSQQTAHFSQTWHILSDSWVPLPGGKQHWPVAVAINNQPAVVILRKSTPMVKLSIGEHQITGQFNWSEIPPRLAIAEQNAFVQLTVQGKKLDFPKIDQGFLWLSQQQIGTADQNDMNLKVFRRLSDGPYLRLETQIVLEISGKLREEVLGPVLLPAFQLSHISSQLPAFLDQQGLLRVKVRPGRWQINIEAHGLNMQTQWQRPALASTSDTTATPNWSTQEIWAFAADESLRSGRLSGAQLIDAQLTSIPTPWKQHPVFLMQAETVLHYQIQHQGRPLQLENQIQLRRDLWLNFDQLKFQFNDQLEGNMVSGWRFTMPAPYELMSAQDKKGPIMVTEVPAKHTQRGVEYHYQNVNLSAQGQLQFNSKLPIIGWNQAMDKVNYRIHLPPAHRLFAVFGADESRGTWWGQWNLWRFFVVLLLGVLTASLFSWPAGLITTCWLVLIYHEPFAPIGLIANALIALAIVRYQPFVRLTSMVNLFYRMSLLASVLALAFFAVMQLRLILHPQLEHFSANLQKYQSEASIAQVLQRADVAPVLEAKSRTRTPVEKDTDSQLVQHYSPDMQVQTGLGRPAWRWNNYSLSWQSPVTAQQSMTLILLKPWQYGLFRVLGILLALAWVFMLIKKKMNTKALKHTASPALIIISFMLLPVLWQSPVWADNFPDQALLKELRQRVTEAPLCAPTCATITLMQLTASKQQLDIQLQAHAQSSSAIALPRSVHWQVGNIRLNNKVLAGLYRQQGWVYIPLEAGISNISLSAAIAPVELFQLEFKEQPLQLVVHSQDWQITGLEQNHLAGNALAFARLDEIQATNKETSGPIEPFVKLKRSLFLGKEWRLKSEVQRLAPKLGAIRMLMPLLPGEQVLNPDAVIDSGHIVVTLSSEQNHYHWDATLPHASQFKWTASSQQHWFEQWQVSSDPSWHTQLQGPPPILSDNDPDEYWTELFYPQAGERLIFNITRPSSVVGRTLAIDEVVYSLKQGIRSAEINLSFHYRSTRGGEHSIALPEGYQLKQVTVDNTPLHLQAEGNELLLPITPGKHHYRLNLRQTKQIETRLAMPAFDLKAPVSNIRSNVRLTKQRWILFASGPSIGPAIVYWGELAVFLILALALGRQPFSPLTTGPWLLLGLGLSLNNWPTLVLVALWFAACSLRKNRGEQLSPRLFNAVQLGLFVLSLSALLALLAAIPQSLLGRPDMGIMGNGSHGTSLRWFLDQSAGLSPNISVISLPIFVYKIVMLGWVMWLSFSLASWIKWAWQAIGVGGYWKTKALIEKP